jgi:uncharacterized protein (DUF1684 family)
MNMKIASLVAAAALAVPALALAQAADPAYAKSINDWRARAERNLKADNGWLTLAGRYVLKPGENTFGTGAGNDIVFPKGTGPAGMGSVFVEPPSMGNPGRVTVKMVEGLRMRKDGIDYAVRDMGTSVEKRDWVSVGRLAFHFIERDGKYILRLADNESEVRKRFGGRVWYEINDNYRVKNARFVPYESGRKISIVNVLDEVSDEPVAGYVEFDVAGRTYKLDALDDDGGLFIIFSDGTSGDTTYNSGRFLYVEEKPAPNSRFTLDLNRAYNPPCAFSEFTTCPLPPKQNQLKVRIEAGEKYPPLKKQA